MVGRATRAEAFGVGGASRNGGRKPAVFVCSRLPQRRSEDAGGCRPRHPV